MPLTAGTKLGPFEILVPLGAGGMGEVYRARDSRLGRDVALKVLPPELLSNREGLLRFAQEARSASALNHPHIVSIFEIGEVDSSPYLVMELIDGHRLRDLIDAGPLPIRRALDFLLQLVEGLAKAHEAGIVHRDLKPENVMVTRDGFVKILDFGLAKLQSSLPSGSERLTQTGIVIGTPDYMSPEQAAGRAVDFRSDQFSLGVLAYEMLTGRRAFRRPTPVQTLSAIIQEEPEPLETLRARVPAPLRWTLERCLSKDPEERYASTRDLVRDLRQIRENLSELISGEARTTRTEAGGARTLVERRGHPAPATSPPATSPPRSSSGPRPRRIRRTAEFLVALAAGVGLFAAGAWAGSWLRGHQAEPTAPSWKGSLLSGAMTRVMAPRVSPDGRALAFATIVGSASHVGVMTPTSGDWTVLTRQSGPGSVAKVCWSRDGDRLYFDRVSDSAQAVFSIPALGGEERLVLENAQGPEALPDGSLLLVRRDRDRNFQLHRFHPDTGRLEPIGPAVVAESNTWSVRAFPDGNRAVFWGKLPTDRAKVRRVYALDLRTGRATAFAPELPIAPPLAVAANGSSVLALATFGDLQQVVAVAASGEQAKTLFPITGRAWSLDGAPDGSLFLVTMDNPAELLRFPVTGGAPERIATTAGNLLTSPVELPDGGLLVPTQVLGRRRLLIAGRQGQLRAFLDSAEQAMPPAAVAAQGELAFLSGVAGKRPVLTLASIASGRILRRLDASQDAAPQTLAVGPDGRTLYYVDAGALFAIGIEGGPPRRLGPANGVAVDPRPPGSLIVQTNDPDGVRLLRSGLDGSGPVPILFMGGLRLAPEPISASAVGPDGRIAVSVTLPDSAFRSVALLDPAVASLERVPVAFDGNLHYAAWAHDGNLLAMGVSIRSSLWRFQPQAVGHD